MNSNEFMANICAGMIPNICKRINNCCDIFDKEGHNKDTQKLRNTTRRELVHLCECMKAITTAQSSELLPIYRQTKERYNNTFGQL